MSRWSVCNLTYLRDIHGGNVAHIPVPHYMPRWIAFSKDSPLIGYRFTFTHAEAITHAHREATKAIAAKNQLPPRKDTPC